MAHNELFLNFRGKTPLKKRHFHSSSVLRHSLLRRGASKINGFYIYLELSHDQSRTSYF